MTEALKVQLSKKVEPAYSWLRLRLCARVKDEGGASARRLRRMVVVVEERRRAVVRLLASMAGVVLLSGVVWICARDLLYRLLEREGGTGGSTEARCACWDVTASTKGDQAWGDPRSGSQLWQALHPHWREWFGEVQQRGDRYIGYTEDTIAWCHYKDR